MTRILLPPNLILKAFGAMKDYMKRIFGTLAVILSIQSALLPQTNPWDKRFAKPGADWYVKDMEYFNDRLYVVVGNKVQTWDGEAWQNYGPSVNGEIYAINFIDGELYIGGNFHDLPDPAANYWARYNPQTAQWIGIDGALNQPVYAIEKFDRDRIAVGGLFTEIAVADNLPKSAFVLWNRRTNQWEGERIDTTISFPTGAQVNTGLSGSVYTMQRLTYGADTTGFAVGGRFSVPKDWKADPYLRTWANDIAIWSLCDNAGNDYGAWQAIENTDTIVGTDYPQLDGEVRSITPIPSGDYAGYLLVGGGFGNAANLNADKVAICSPTRIIPLESEGRIRINGLVYATAVTEKYFYIGGYFTTEGDFSASNIVRFNRLTHHWEQLAVEDARYDMPLNNEVKKIIAVSDSVIYISGLFREAGGIAHADYIVKYDGRQWISLGLGLEGAENNSGRVNAIENYNGKIFVAGDFLDASGKLNADYCAVWDGTDWQAVADSALSGPVYRVYKDDLGLILIGAFQNAGGISEADRIVRWTGTNFESLGPNSGISENITINAITNYQGSYIIGGAFTQINGQPLAYIARYNGNGWEQFGNPLNYYVTQLIVFNDTLYVSGAFSDAEENEQADCLVKWDGTMWQPAAGSFNDDESPAVYSFALAAEGLYISGRFSDLGGNGQADNIALWDGTNWQSLGSGFSAGWANKITKLNGKIIAGGSFTLADSVPNADILAQFDGTDWSPLVEPAFYQSEVNDFGIFANKLYAGGDFTVMNNQTTYCSKFGIYDLTDFFSNDVAENPLPVPDLSHSYPNPFNNSATIRFNVPRTALVTLKIYDVLGRELRTLIKESKAAGDYTVAFDAGNLANGLYLYRLRIGAHTETRKMLLLK